MTFIINVILDSIAGMSYEKTSNLKQKLNCQQRNYYMNLIKSYYSSTKYWVYFTFVILLCTTANLLSAQSVIETLTIRNEESINTKALEYCPVFYKNKLVFTSTRPTPGSPITRWRDEKKQFSDLYIAEKSEDGDFFNAQRLPGKASSPVHDGVAAFNKTGNEIFFTRNNENGKNEKNVINLKIYTAQLVNNIWQNIQELPLNDEDFSNCHPTLSSDGRELYFASNRPGGFGGMDIYVSKNINGVWQQPQNLGATVNSESNELFPFIAGTNTLYFASNNSESLGGLDIFKAERAKEAAKFNPAKNLGEDFNSEADDFGLCINEAGNEGYFSSNRKEGKGGDDIYYFKWTPIILPPEQVSLEIYDAHSTERVSGAVITIFDEGIEHNKNDIYPIAKMMSLTTEQMNNPYHTLEKKSYRTGAKGEIAMIIGAEKSYTIFVEKEGYLPFKKVIAARELSHQKKWKLALKRMAGIPLKVNAINMPFRERVAFVSLELFNHCTQETERAFSDENGLFTFYLACDCEYELTGKKDAYRKYQKRFNTKYRECGDLNAINTEIYLVEQEVIEHISSTGNLRFPSFASYNAQDIRKVGQIICLENVVFEENKADLLPKAIKEIYKVHYFLQQYPQIQVEISVHTDARGTAKFNHRLSQKRANAIADFLLGKGIPKTQLYVVGYGEDRLINHCQDGIRCSEAEHLQNKRVEMKIAKIGKLIAERWGSVDRE